MQQVRAVHRQEVQHQGLRAVCVGCDVVFVDPVGRGVYTGAAGEVVARVGAWGADGVRVAVDARLGHARKGGGAQPGPLSSAAGC